MFVLDARFEVAVHGLEKVLAVKSRVEPQDCAAEQALQQLDPPRTDAERLGVRPGDVPEGDDGRRRQTRLDHRRQQREVVVLDEDDRILAAGFGDDRVGETLIDLAIGLPIRLAKHRSNVGDMAERPHALVGEAVVVALLLLRGEPDPAQHVVVFARRHQDPVVRVDDAAIRVAAAVRDPCARSRHA